MNDFFRKKNKKNRDFVLSNGLQTVEKMINYIPVMEAIAAGQADEEIQMDNAYADFDLIKKIRTALSGAAD